MAAYAAIIRGCGPSAAWRRHSPLLDHVKGGPVGPNRERGGVDREDEARPKVGAIGHGATTPDGTHRGGINEVGVVRVVRGCASSGCERRYTDARQIGVEAFLLDVPVFVGRDRRGGAQLPESFRRVLKIREVRLRTAGREVQRGAFIPEAVVVIPVQMIAATVRGSGVEQIQCGDVDVAVDVFTPAVPHRMTSV